MNFLIKPKEKAHFLDEIPTNQALFWKAIAPSYLSNIQVLGVFWNPLVISFPMYTETLQLSQKITEKIEFKETYPTFKDSLGLESDSRPQSSLNPFISAHNYPNPITSVPIK